MCQVPAKGFCAAAVAVVTRARKNQTVAEKRCPGRIGPPLARCARPSVATVIRALLLCLLWEWNRGGRSRLCGRPGLIVVVGAGTGKTGQGIEIEGLFKDGARFLGQVSDKDFAHLLVTKLTSLHQD